MTRRASDEEELEPERADLWNLPLLEFIEQASGGRFRAPTHFAPIAEEIERAERLEAVRLVAAAPVQHGKTTLLEFAIAWILLRHPDRPVIYVTYAQRKAEKHSRRIRSIYLACGGRIKADFNTIQQWQTDRGGGLLATSRDGEITGNDAVHIFFDDPYKDRAEAENADVRELLEEKFSSEIVTRIAPGGSIVIVASRWDEDDLSGVKIREGYTHVHLRAIEVDEHGEERALCPWGPDPKYPRTLEFLRSLRDGPDITDHDWCSLYQGEPRPRNAGLFHDATFADALPALTRIVVGADFAYSGGGDRIAIVVLGESDETVRMGDVDVRVLYVLHVWTIRKSAIEAHEELRDALLPWSDCKIGSYVTTPERGVLVALSTHEDPHRRIFVQPLSAVRSKIERAGRCSRRWNAGAIRVLRGQAWSESFARVVRAFHGLKGGRDDEVDALVSAHDLLTIAETFKTSGGGFKTGRRRM